MSVGGARLKNRKLIVFVKMPNMIKQQQIFQDVD